MILTVLGCNGPYPVAGGVCSGYLVSSDSGNTHVLMECGPGVMGQLFKYLPLDSLTAMMLSHLHFDHMSDALPLHYALEMSKRQNLTVYAPKQPEMVRGLLENRRMDLLEPKDCQIGELTFTFLPTVHPVPGYSIGVQEGNRRMVYTGDTNAHDALELFVDGADLLLADSGLLEADWKPTAPHLSAKRCGALARQASVSGLVLTHFNPRYHTADLLREAQTEYPAAQLAHLGMRIMV